MKKIFTLMLAFACALFAGVSCTPNSGLEGGEDNTPKAIVFEEVGELDANGGSLNLNYTLTNEVLGTQLVLGEPTATWLTVELPDEGNYVVLNYTKNLESPNSPAREASFTATYGDNEPVVVTVKQASLTEVSFEIAWDEATLSCNFASYTVKSEVNPNMLYLSASDLDFQQYGIQGETVVDKFNNYVAFITQNFIIGTEVGSTFEGDNWWYYKGNMQYPKELYRQTADDVYVYAVGINITATESDSWGTYATGIELATPIHTWKAAFLPFPTINVTGDLQKNVTAEAGSLELDVKVENPIEGNNIMVSVDENVTWAVPTYADGKLTVAYEANTAALPREAKIYIDYGMMNDWGYPQTVAEQVVVTLTQAKDDAAEVVTFDIQVVETHFNRIVVNVTPSNTNVPYYLNLAQANDYDGNPIDINWIEKVTSDLKYGGDKKKVFTGALENHTILTQPGNYEFTGYDFHVYAFAVQVNKATVEGEDDTYAPAGEASHVLTTVNIEDFPKLTLNGGGLVWNADQNRYDLTVSKAGTVTFNYEVTNPVDGASVKLNGNKINDNYNLVAGDDIPTIDATNKTITLELNGYPENWTYSWAPSISPTFLYSDNSEQYWGVQAQIKIVWVEDPGMQLPYQESFADGIGNFTINNVDIDGLDYVWKHDSEYKQMKASAYVSGVKHATESWLESPKIDLSAATMPGLQFSHTHKFAGTPANELTLWVKEWGAAEWTQVTIPTYGTNNDWTFVTAAVDLSAWAGKKVQIGFKYTSSTSAAATWEIKNVVVYDAGGAAAPLM